MFRSSLYTEYVSLEQELAAFAKDRRGLGDLGRIKVFMFVWRDGGVEIGDERSNGQLVRWAIRGLKQVLDRS